MDQAGINNMEKDFLKMQIDLMKKQVDLERTNVSVCVKEWVKSRPELFTAVYGGLYVQIKHFLFFSPFFRRFSLAPTELIGLKFWLWVLFDHTNFLPSMSHDDPDGSKRVIMTLSR